MSTPSFMDPLVFRVVRPTYTKLLRGLLTTICHSIIHYLIKAQENIVLSESLSRGISWIPLFTFCRKILIFPHLLISRKFIKDAFSSFKEFSCPRKDVVINQGVRSSNLTNQAYARTELHSRPWLLQKF